MNLADNPVLTMSSYKSKLSVFLKKITLKPPYTLVTNLAWKYKSSPMSKDWNPETLACSKHCFLALKEEPRTVERQQKSTPPRQYMNRKQLHLAANQVLFQLHFEVFCISHSVINEFNILKDVWQPFSIFAETCMPAESKPEFLAIFRYFCRKVHA